METTSPWGADRTLADALKRTAPDTNQSVNRLIPERLRTEEQRTQMLDELDDLFGNWPEEEYLSIGALCAGIKGGDGGQGFDYIPGFRPHG